MSTERNARHRIVRLAIAIAAAAALIAPPAATVSAPPTPMPYCPRYDAYEVQHCSPQHLLPDSPVGRQLSWTLDQLAGGASTLTVAEVRAHLTASLRQVVPARQMLESFRQTLTERGPMRFVGFSYPPRSEQATAILASATAVRGAVALGVDG